MGGIPVVFADRAAFGEPTESKGLLYSGITLSVERGVEHDAVRLSAVTTDEGKVLAIYTDASPEWVVPVLEPRDPEREAQADRWDVTASDNGLSSTAQDLLLTVWEYFGIQPSKAGQIILRPRNAVVSTTASTTSAGKLDLKYEHGTAWIVQVLGVQIDQVPNYYWTGVLILIDDKSGKVVRGLFMP
jgi:hypothetical protein